MAHLRRLSAAALAAGLVAAALAAGCDPVVRGRCDPLFTGSCPTGDKCSYLLGADVEPRCHAVAGSRDVDEYCSVFADDCLPGLQCTPNTDGTVLTCRKFCATDADCGPGRRCSVMLIGGDRVCSDPDETCSPLAQDCSDPAQACYGAPLGTPACYTPRMNAPIAGEPCAGINQCARGATCLFLANVEPEMGQCFAFCDPDLAEGGCPADLTCQPAGEPFDFHVCR